MPSLLKEGIVDLTMSDSDSDVIAVKPRTPAKPKRKAVRLSDSDSEVKYERPTKRIRTRSAKAHDSRRAIKEDDIVYDLDQSSDDGEPRTKQNPQTRTATRGRPVLQQLDAAQFSNRVRERLFVQRPRYKKSFLSQFVPFGPEKVAQSTGPSAPSGESDIRRFFSTSVPTFGTATRVSRQRPDDARSFQKGADENIVPKRKSSTYLRRHDSPVESGESDDELSNSRTARQTKGKVANRTQLQSESEYEGSSDSDQCSIDSVATPDGVSDSSSIDAFSDSEEDVSYAKTAKTKPKATSKRASKPKTNGTDISAEEEPRHTPVIGRMVNLINRKAVGVDESLPPLHDIDEIFADLTRRAVHLGLDHAAEQLKHKTIRVGTMCSGTESPLLALEMINDSLRSMDSIPIRTPHVSSAEIVPFKQAFIARNWDLSTPIFRDIREMAAAVHHDIPMATTAFGGKMQIVPADILIAGTSCVDLSRKNNHRKTLSDGGESDDTWHAVLDVCKAFRPTIVLLENVRGDALGWNEMLSDYEAIGYEVAGVTVDTKDYYLPQTRERGYMACFNKDKLGDTGAATQWATLMASLRRRCSSPVSDFLLPMDRVTLQQMRDDEAQRDSKWEICEARLAKYLVDHRLSTARPLTKEGDSGEMVVRENGHAAWIQKQVPRVRRTLDASYIRCALPKRGMFDARYKTRIWDTSQNIDRSGGNDGQHFGIVPCITPTGRYFISDDSRPITPVELLILQGIPLRRTSFTTESQAEMQDLAGNAMSTPVIGCSIAAALVAGASILRETCPDQDKQPERLLSRHLKNLDGHAECIDITANEITSDLSVTLQEAWRAKRMCYCEAADEMTDSPIQSCQDCGHTTCIVCGGNPPHNYAAQRPALPRMSPALFKEQLKRRLPLTVGVSADPEALAWLSSSDVPNTYQELLRSALSQQYFLHDTRRTHHWTIMYRAGSSATLQLVLLDDQAAEWRLFAHAPNDLPGNDHLRSILHHPVAKSIAGASLMPDTWTVRTPCLGRMSLDIEASGSQVPSYWCRNEMPDFPEHFLWEYLDIAVRHGEAEDRSTNDLADLVDEISGRYRHLPNCGTSFDALYQKVDEAVQRPLYLFLNPTRTRDPAKDCFVFSYEKADLQRDEVRDIVARLDARWRPWSREGKCIARRTSADLIIDDTWKSTNVRLEQVHEQAVASRVTDVGAVSFASSDCSYATTLARCDLPLPDRPSIEDSIEQSVILDPSNYKFILEHRWAYEALRRCLLGADMWHTLHKDISACDKCAPPKPTLRWKLTHGDEIAPYEDPKAAAQYEKAIKTRPDVLTLSARWRSRRLELSLAVHINALAHRAHARLARFTSSTALFDWRLITSQEESSRPKPFKLRETFGIAPFRGRLDMTIELSPKQLISLAWRIQQERGIACPIEEIEETTIPHLGWRLEGRAKAQQQVRGGICADHPGFGKTVVSLALIQSQVLSSTKLEIVAEVQKLQPVAQGLIPTQATLIVCPGILVKQWATEIESILGWTEFVLTINTIADLNKLTINDFQNAKIIIANRSILGSELYAERLAAFAAIPGPATKSGRGFSQWLSRACAPIPSHLDILLTRGGSDLERHVKAEYKQNISSDEFKAVVPSRRLRGKEYQAAKGKGKTTVTLKAALRSVDTSKLGNPLFEQYAFDRLIVDEFHQLDTREHAAIVNIRAAKRWGLSGTPALGDLHDVAQMGGLLGIPLQSGSDAPGIMKNKNIKSLRKDRTDFEKFEAMRTAPSDALHSHMWESRQRFLDIFVSQNVGDDLPRQEHLVPVELDATHLALYTELSQHLISSDMRVTKGGSPNSTHRQKRISAAVKAAESAEETLAQATTTLSSSIDDDMNEPEATWHEFHKVLENVIAKEPEVCKEWQAGISKLGDTVTVGQIQQLIEQAATPEYKSGRPLAKQDEGTTEKKKESQYESLAALRSHSHRLLTANRSARYLRNVRKLHGQNGHKRLSRLCDCSDCLHSSDDLAVSASCGHIVCRSCFEALSAKAMRGCPTDGCAASMHPCQLLWKKKMSTSIDCESHGAKIDAAVEILSQIAAKNEQAVLFVQFEGQLQQVKAALDESNIAAVVVKSNQQAGDQIADFRDSAGTSQQKTVIVLNASDETAAGLNLQNANHIIFLSPLLKDTQWGYESTMAQAIGRVSRPGQKREIHVHRIVALNTIDVDILEHRERRIDALVEQGEPSMPPQPALVHDQPARERTQLVRENGKFSLRPRSWLLDSDGASAGEDTLRGPSRVLGWEDFSSLVKFSKAFTENDE